MTTLNDFSVADLSIDVLAIYYNKLLGSIFRKEFSNVVTMSTDLTLTDGDTPIQRLDCNGANRIVKVAASAAGNHPYLLINTTSSGSWTLTVKSNDGTTVLKVLDPGDIGFFLPDGNGEYVEVGAGVSDHGALTGLGDDDHTQYLLASGLREWSEQASNPSTPAATKWKLFFKGDGLYYIDDAGVVTGPLEVATNSFLNNYLTGLISSNNALDVTNDIDIAAGQATDSTNAVLITITAAFTKKLDANWAPGTNQGMRNSGAAITNTTYHIYAVAKADGVDPDYYAHTSTTISTVITALQAETGGSAYIYARRILSIVRTGGAIKRFVQDGDRFTWLVPVQDVNAANPGTSAVTRTLTVPTGIRVEANLTLDGYGGNSAGMPRGIFLSDLSITDTVVNDACFTVYINTSAAIDLALGVTTRVMTNTAAQIRSRLQQSTGDTNLIIVTHGWLDTRGR